MIRSMNPARCNESIADGDADVNGDGYEKSWINSNPMLMKRGGEQIYPGDLETKVKSR